MRITIESPVKGQLEAYNKRDLDSFVSYYSNDVVVYDMKTGDIKTSGMEQFRKVYDEVFEQSPKLKCKIVKRIVMTEFVIDEEKVAGLRGRTTQTHATAIYQVENQKIKKVWFCR